MANPAMIRAINARNNVEQTPAINVDTTTTIESTLTGEHAAAIRETESHQRSVTTVKTYNGRINSMIEWVREFYPDKATIMTRELTDSEKAQGLTYYKATHDFVYSSIDITIIKAFISTNKIKSVDEDGKPTFYCWDHSRKYHDAILYGSKRGKQSLPPSYKAEMKEFLDSLKKENQQKKKLGQVDEQEADPITMPFYVEIVKWCVKKGYIFLWCFTVLQWNCMARSCNIDALTWKSFKTGKDSIEIKFFDTKKDKEGKKCSPKNCYANPYNPFICLFTALACYLAIFDEKFQNGKQSIFLNPGVKRGTCSHIFCSSLKDLFKEMGNRIYQWIRPGHDKDHGIRKGAAIECTSGTTAPPSASAVARRGDWSLGKVFDIYWLFAEAGDHYCGRILAGLDSLSDKFDVLPPHFNTATMSEEELNFVQECIKDNFPNIYKMGQQENHPEILPMLFMIFASLIYNYQFLLEMASGLPSHPFLLIPILQQPEKLEKLKQFITTEKSETINAPTGIPPHVIQNRKLDLLNERLIALEERQISMISTIEKTVEKTIEQNAVNNGQLTLSSFSSAMKQMQDDTMKGLENMRTEFNENIARLSQPTRPAEYYSVNQGFQNNIEVEDHRITRFLHGYQGKMWHVPQSFAFPTTGGYLKVAWRLWHLGMPNFKKPDGSSAPVMPFKKMEGSLIPKGKVRNQFKVCYKPILTKMMQAPDLPFGDDPRSQELTSAVIDTSYETAMNHLKAHYSYIFSNPKFQNHNQWNVSVWSKMTGTQMVKQYGSEEDISKLPPDTHRNKSRKRKRNNDNIGVGNEANS